MTYEPRFIELAKRLLTKYGGQFFIERNTGSVSNPDGTVTSVTETLTGMCVNYPYQAHEIDGTNVLVSDTRFYVETTNLIPLVGDRFTFGSTTYRIKNVESIQPSGVNIMYIVQAAK